MPNFKNFLAKVGLIVFAVLGLSLFGANLVFAATPVIDNNTIATINIIDSGAQIGWTTDISSDSMVMYGTTSGAYSSYSSSRCDAGGMVTSHCANLTGLNYNTIYYYKVRSSDGTASPAAESSEKTFISASDSSGTTTTVPAMPSSLRGTGSTTTSISLAWNDNSTNEDKFNLERKLSSSNTYSLVIQTSGNATTYTDYSVATGTSYDYRVQACLSGTGCSDYTYVYGLYTTSAATAITDTTPPYNPSTPSIYSQTSNSVILQWTAPGDDGSTGTVSGYEIKYSTTSQGTMTLDQWWSQATTSSDVIYDPSALVSAGTTQRANVYGLYPSITYYFAVKARDEVSNLSSPSGIIPATTLSGTSATNTYSPPVPSTPTGSTSGTTNISYMYSTYLYPDSNGDQVKAIFDWGDGTTSYTSWNYPVIGGLSVTANHIWTTAGTYYVKVKAQDYGGLESNWTATLAISIGAAQTITSTPAMPSSLRGTGSTTTSISLAWNDNSTNEDKFNLERKLSSSNTYSLVIQTSGNVTTYTDYSIVAGTSYDYRVQACLSGTGCSDYTYVYGLYTSTSGNISATTAIKTIKGKVAYSDGKAVTNAGIGAYNSTSGLWANAYSDSSGNYSIKVSGGKWQVSVYPSTTSGQVPDWIYTKTPDIISFADDSTISEEITLNFQVETTQSSIKGYILKSDGAAPGSGMAGISLKDASGYEHKTFIDQNGYFLTYLISGVYTAQIFSLDYQSSAPSSFNFSINQGEQKDLGKLYLTSNTEKIKGKVMNSSGAGIGNVWINANQYLNNKFVQTKTVSDGSYELWVSPGEWELNVYSDSTAGYYSTQEYKKVSISAGQTAEINFSLSSADSQISGNIIDSSGQILTDIHGSVYAGNFSGSIENGAFDFKISPGTYTLYVYLPSDSKYSPPSSRTITVLSGENKKITLTASTLNAVISGSLKDSAGNLITNLNSDKVKIYVSAKNGAWYNAYVNPSQGYYNVGVSSGTWYLNYWVDPSSGYTTTEMNKEITVSAGQTYKYDIFLAKSDSFISGTTKSSDGKALAGVWISIDTASLTGSTATETTVRSIFAAGDNSDANGNFKIAVPAGAYYVHSYYSPTFGYINPPEIKVEVSAGKTITVDLIFKKPEIKITGSISISGVKKSAFVWAWGESGGYAETRSDDNGLYSLDVSQNNKWHISSSADINGVYHKSADIVVSIENQTPPSQDIVLTPVYTFAQAVEKIVEATSAQSVALTDGAKIILPANSLATTGNVNISLKPAAEAPSFGHTSIVGSSYEVEAKDTAGQSINNLNSEITITIPYNEEDLTAKGLNPEDLTLSFFDETTSSWKSLEKQVVDKKSKVVSGVVNHLTRFALVAPADTTPPPGPSSVKISTLTDKTVKIAWVNPKLDFSHARIYRSEKLGELGSLAYGNITEESQIDNKTSIGKTYYYTVRAVDLAGNESSNTGQASPSKTTATAVATTTTSASFKFSKSLYKGLADNEVKKLQELLAKDKAIYPEGVISGYFGSLTESAIKRFQTKYGITESLGAVGPKTREQLNNLLGQEVKEFVTGAFKFSKSLYKGLADNEVKKLQELLAKDKAIYPEGVISGYFGSLTESAIKRFQTKYGIESIGIVGPKTRTKLNELNSQ